MKFRNLIPILLIVLLVLAWFTKPSLEDFQKFHQEQPGNLSTPPVIAVTNGFVYSMYEVSYYDIKETSLKVKDGKNAALAIPREKQKYLGLFGRFWKM